MSVFAKKTLAAPPAAPSTPAPAKARMKKNSIFGGITKPKAAYEKNYFTPGIYRVALSEIVVDVSKNPKHLNEPYGRANFKILDAQPPVVDALDAPQRVGAEVSTTKYFSGSGAEYALRDWRNICCAVMGIDESGIHWESLTEAEVQEFVDACDDMAESPEQYYGNEFMCNCTERIVNPGTDAEKRYTNMIFSIAED